MAAHRPFGHPESLCEVAGRDAGPGLHQLQQGQDLAVGEASSYVIVAASFGREASAKEPRVSTMSTEDTTNHPPCRDRAAVGAADEWC